MKKLLIIILTWFKLNFGRIRDKNNVDYYSKMPYVEKIDSGDEEQ